MAQLITAAQNLTASWADLGSPIPVNQYARIGLYARLDINDSLNARIRAIAMRGQADTVDYTFPISTVGTSDVKIEAEYLEFNTDADQNMIFEIITNGIAPYVQIQVQAGTVGATAGQIDEADYFLSRIA